MTKSTQFTQPDIAVADLSRLRAEFSRPSWAKSALGVGPRAHVASGFGADLRIVAGVRPRGAPV